MLRGGELMKLARSTFGKRGHLCGQLRRLLPLVPLFLQLEFANIKVDIAVILRRSREGGRYRSRAKPISRGSMRIHVATHLDAASSDTLAVRPSVVLACHYAGE